MNNNERDHFPEDFPPQNPMLSELMSIDELGRLVIPSGIIKVMRFAPKEALNITLYKDSIILKKHIPYISRQLQRIGLIRKLGKHNRLVLPAELREELQFSPLQTVLVQLSGDEIVIQKYDAA